MRLGPYEILDELGRGGMGRVVRARHVPTSTLRALKVLDGDLTPESIDRFRREVAALARVGGAHAVPVHETGVERRAFWFAMDLMPGGSLRARLAKTGPLPWREAVALVAKLARGLGECHRAGLVHRDVKPENVLFDDRGEPRLGDFGCVKDLAASRLTETGATIGTPNYSAPEQLAGEPVGPPADVFALGVVCHELLTGERPFRGSSVLELSRRIAEGRRERAAKSPGAPDELDRLLDRALDARPGRRPRDASALAAELEALLAPPRAPPPARGRRGAAVALATLAVLAFGTLVAASRRAPPATAHREEGAAPVLSPTVAAPSSGSAARTADPERALAEIAAVTARLDRARGHLLGQEPFRESDERLAYDALLALEAANRAAAPLDATTGERILVFATAVAGGLGSRAGPRAAALYLRILDLGDSRVRRSAVQILGKLKESSAAMEERCAREALIIARDEAEPLEERRFGYVEAVQALKRLARYDEAWRVVDEGVAAVHDPRLEIERLAQEGLDQRWDEVLRLSEGLAERCESDDGRCFVRWTRATAIFLSRQDPKGALAELDRAPRDAAARSLQIHMARVEVLHALHDDVGARADLERARTLAGSRPSERVTEQLAHLERLLAP